MKITVIMSEDNTFIYHNQLPSTNSYMQELLSKGMAGHMTVVCTGFQTAGRGQVGNKWESESGKNLLFSIAVKPSNLNIHSQFYLSKAISVAILDVLNNITGGFEIKWPNDIYYKNSKIAGILIENNLRGGNIESSVVGVGLNVNQEKFVSDAPNPLSLKQITNQTIDTKALLTEITASAKIWITALDNHQYETIDSVYRRHLYRRDGYHPFKDKEGEFEARLEEVKPEGYLVLRDTGNRIRSYAFKEVTYII